MNDTYWYLASPYSKYPGGHEAAFKLSCENAALLLTACIPTFAPIAHSHPLVEHGGLKAVDHDFWINTVDRPMMRGAKGLIFLEANGWQNSSGMSEEIVEFTKAGKPIVFMQPGVIPEGLLEAPMVLGELSDVIQNISPTKTPFMVMAEAIAAQPSKQRVAAMDYATSAFVQRTTAAQEQAANIVPTQLTDVAKDYLRWRNWLSVVTRNDVESLDAFAFAVAHGKHPNDAAREQGVTWSRR